ncbi:CHAP domain-containing protein [Staphylococcus agnetis]|uniref:CHAP domain-containing protein n=1 Tax=Staphylococcus agnetis TaxID=985762 RepID=UPI0004E4397F|nr:CHAP domain-containing protein [Staphylococcus agnetis]KFE41582.1 secretory antigen precursor SsaA [Staphylococcus agnetis]NJH64578.1 CHAP domain-containing protein [Staphylococcus agnetis]NJH98469.1 CHAP domain-containing protein [Staphylococcus agnetis]PTH48659.1 CHAP domain-containing protein [Staphylococcus agnetis]PTH73362.1 CHAP domain-containing protein [Staphylococcus agnetis]
MKKLIATTSIATAGVAAITLAHGHDADAAEYNGGYNPNDPTSYSYSYTIDQNNNYHFTWQGNWSPAQFNGGNGSSYYYTTQNNYNYASTSNYRYNTTASNYNYSAPTTSAPKTTTSNQSYTTSSTSASRTVSKGTSGSNLYTAGQCTYYVFDRVGGTIGSTWGNANNWASAAAAAGYTVNHTPKAGAILQTTSGPFGHVAYVESVNSNGTITVSEMNYGQGPGVVTSRTISAAEAASYKYIH